jgi:hypothetical protein
MREKLSRVPMWEKVETFTTETQGHRENLGGGESVVESVAILKE